MLGLNDIVSFAAVVKRERMADQHMKAEATDGEEYAGPKRQVKGIFADVEVSLNTFNDHRSCHL